VGSPAAGTPCVPSGAAVVLPLVCACLACSLQLYAASDVATGTSLTLKKHPSLAGLHLPMRHCYNTWRDVGVLAGSQLSTQCSLIVSTACKRLTRGQHAGGVCSRGTTCASLCIHRQPCTKTYSNCSWVVSSADEHPTNSPYWYTALVNHQSTWRCTAAPTSLASCCCCCCLPVWVACCTGLHGCQPCCHGLPVAGGGLPVAGLLSCHRHLRTAYTVKGSSMGGCNGG
jgi:hypothetical protein